MQRGMVSSCSVKAAALRLAKFVRCLLSFPFSLTLFLVLYKRYTQHLLTDRHYSSTIRFRKLPHPTPSPTAEKVLYSAPPSIMGHQQASSLLDEWSTLLSEIFLYQKKKKKNPPPPPPKKKEKAPKQEQIMKEPLSKNRTA